MCEGSLAYSMNTVQDVVMLPVIAAAAICGPMAMAGIGLAITVTCIIGCMIFVWLSRRSA